MRKQPDLRASSKADDYFQRGVHRTYEGSTSKTIEFNRIVGQLKDAELRLADEFLHSNVPSNARRYGTLLNAMARRAYAWRYCGDYDLLSLRQYSYLDIIYELQYLLKDENIATRDKIMDSIAHLCHHRKLHRSFARAYHAETPEELFQIVKESLNYMPKEVVRNIVIPQLIAKKLED